MRENQIGIYEKALNPQPWNAFFDAAARAGFDYVELSLDESDLRLSRLDWDYSQCEAVRRAANDAGIRLMSACFSGHRRFPLGSADREIEKRSLEMLKQATQLCDRLGIRILQIAGYDVYYEPSNEGTAKRYRDNLIYGTKWAEEYGVMYAIEPVELFLTSVSKALEIVRAANSPWLKVYPDAANMAAVGIDPIPEIEGGLSDSVALHMREALPNYFKNVEFGTGIIDFKGLFSMLKRHHYHGPMTIEMWNEDDPDYMNVITRARTFLEREWDNA